MWIRRLLVLLSLACSAFTANAMERSFPQNTVFGAVMSIAGSPQVIINGRPRQLSAGARIRNTDNLIVMSSTLGSKSMLVNYTVDLNGDIQEVWILTDAEARSPSHNILK